MSADRSRAWSGAWPGAHCGEKAPWKPLRTVAPRVLTHRQRHFCPMEAPSWAVQSVLGVTQGLPGLCRVENQCPRPRPLPTSHKQCEVSAQSPGSVGERKGHHPRAPRLLPGPVCRRPSLGQCSTSPHPKGCLGAPAAEAHFLGTQRPEVSTCPPFPLR